MLGALEEEEPSWTPCGDQGCVGIPLPGQERCLAHVEKAERAAFLINLQPGAGLDLRGTPFSADLLDAVLTAVTEDGKPKLGVAWFDGAQFSQDAWFRGAQFRGDTWFRGAQFGVNAGFVGARFGRSVSFAGAQFREDAEFDVAQFGEFAEFRGAQFGGNARFGAARFGGNARFDAARFGGNARFDAARFGGDVRFDEARFRRHAEFDGAQFGGDAGFIGAEFRGAVRFGGAQFTRAEFTRARFVGAVRFDGAQFTRYVRFDEVSAARVLGPLLAENELSLRRASFSAPILIEASTPRLSLVGAAFAETASLRLRFAETVLDGASFTKPSTMSFAETAFPTSAGQLRDQALETDHRNARPRLLGVRLVDLSNLALGNFDLSACLFQGAHNLEKLRIEGPLRFVPTPGTWQLHFRRWWIPIWRSWTRRQALAEEHHFRAPPSSTPGEEEHRRVRHASWNPPSAEQTEWVRRMTGQPVQTLSPESLATLYRALRKGLEDQKNAPGAADFYYGEMEMRRHSRTSPWADRFVLWVYWLFSGYGVRASRALVAFALLVPLFAIGFWLWGLAPEHGHRVTYAIALLRSFESATSLLRAPPQGLTEIGQLLDAFLRLIGATLLGLALFSLRGRIKR